MTEEEKYVLDYTASTKWIQIKKLDWTTAEMMDIMKQYAKQEKIKLLEYLKEHFTDVNFRIEEKLKTLNNG